MADVKLLDVSPVVPLIRTICTWNLLKIYAVHLVIKGTDLILIVNMSGWVHHDPFFTFTEEESSWGEKQAIYEPPDSSRENQEKMVYCSRDNENRKAVRTNTHVVVM